MDRKNQISQLTEDVSENPTSKLDDPRWLHYMFKRDKLKRMSGGKKKKNPLYVTQELGMQTRFQCPECEEIVDADDAVVVGPGKITCSICAAKNHRIFPESFKEWLILDEISYTKKKEPRHTKLVGNYKEKFSKGSIDIRSHIKDYVPHIEKLGDGLGPFKILKSRGKSVAPVAH